MILRDFGGETKGTQRFAVDQGRALAIGEPLAHKASVGHYLAEIAASLASARVPLSQRSSAHSQRSARAPTALLPRSDRADPRATIDQEGQSAGSAPRPLDAPVPELEILEPGDRVSEQRPLPVRP